MSYIILETFLILKLDTCNYTSDTFPMLPLRLLAHDLHSWNRSEGPMWSQAHGEWYVMSKGKVSLGIQHVPQSSSRHTKDIRTHTHTHTHTQSTHMHKEAPNGMCDP